MAARGLISKLAFISSSAGSPTAAATCGLLRAFAASRSSPLLRLRPLLTLSDPRAASIGRSSGIRCFSTRQATSSLNDPSPNWSNRPPKETILLDGCDFEHWLVVVEPPDQNWTREEIIDSYIKTLAEVVGSEEKARHSIYSVSTKHYFAFGALVSEELSYKIKALPKVRWVLPDSYLNVREKDYGGEPFINGEAVPYHPKYHEEWIKNHNNVNKPRRPRNNGSSRNFERRGENMQSYPNRDAPPGNQSFQNPVPPPGIQSFQNSVPPGTGAQNTMPPRQMPPVPSGNFNPPGGNTNNDGQTGGTYYPNQMPNPRNTYGQNDGRGMPTAPAFQGNSTQGYQGGPDQGVRPPSFQQGPPSSFQRGNSPPGFQQGPPTSNYQQGTDPGFQQGPPPNYQQGTGPGFHQGPPPPNYQQGTGPGFQQGPPPPSYQQGTGPGFQQGPPPPSYQQGSGPGFQQGPQSPSYHQGISPAYQQNAIPGYQPYARSNQSGEAYQVRDVPGRDQ